jgi:hypothetical protein
MPRKNRSPRLQPVTSSLIAGVAYDFETATLHLRLRSGEHYDYFAVPRSTYEALMTAPSKGRFYGSHIRDRFPYARVRRSA